MTKGADRPGSLRERNRLRTRGDILDAAAEILGAEGYAAMSIEAVGQQAGVSRGTIYAHFPGGRDEIVRDVYQRIADGVFVRGISLRDGSAGHAERIVALARVLVEATREPLGRFYGVMGPDVAAVVGGLMGSTSTSFQQLIIEDLDEAKSQGMLSTEAPTAALAVTITGAIRAAGATAALNPEESERTIEAVRMLCEGLLLTATV